MMPKRLNFAAEDLLGRSAVVLESAQIRDGIRGKTVMITGAGGSIGSELSRQIAKYQPGKLVLFERNENNLYMIQLELIERNPALALAPVLGDITDRGNLERAFYEHKIDLLFHAAAYKHVPMMEAHPIEAIKNNVQGTLNLVELSKKHHVERFVLVSTDKAVRPTNIMGRTKRIAEKIATAFHREQNGCKLMSVRFGNVLGSTGSVIPLFMRQIADGGPVTVTDKDATRYFMTITEAVQLVMQAAVMGEGGETFILEMGRKVRILDLAQKLIALAGLKEGEDVQVVFTGLRPGEKLTEELSASDEDIQDTGHEKIKQVKGAKGSVGEDFLMGVQRLLHAAVRLDSQAAIKLLEELSNGACSSKESG